MSVLVFILEIGFWLSVAGLFHSYVFYPALVAWLARGRENHEYIHRDDTPDSQWPYMVAMMAAHNEESVIEATLASLFAADYPAGRFEVIVAADNCTDRTVEIVKRFQAAHPNLILRQLPGRNGKVRSLNLAMEENRERLGAQGDFVVILCDANVRWSRQLPRELAKHFRNPRIGVVATNVLDSRREHQGIADQEEAYINRENAVKFHEGILWGCMMGAFGACFAMRGRLFKAVPEHFRSDDFTHTLYCLEQGCEAIVEPAAIAWEDVSEDIKVEFGRKIRISLGNFQNLCLFWKFLLPWNAGWPTTFAFWSHKGIRWMGPFLIAGSIISGFCLAAHHWIYSLAVAGQCALILGALADGWLTPRGIHCRPLRYIRYFLLMNVALAMGAWRFLRGEDRAFWEPARRVSSNHLPPASLSDPAPPRNLFTESRSTPDTSPVPREPS